MENSMPAREQRWLVMGGLATCMLSLLIFHLGQVFGITSDFDLDPFFLGNYAIALGWMVLAVVYNVNHSGWRRMFKLPPALYRITLILFTISAFSLNRNLAIMGETPYWVGVYLYIAFAALMLDSFASKLPYVLNLLTNFLCGSGIALVTYYMILSIPALPLSVVALVFFGISIHMFTPLFAFFGFAGVVRRRDNLWMRISFAIGIFIPIVILMGYSIQIKQIADDIEQVTEDHRVYDSDLPLTVFAGQYLEDRMFSGHIMRSEDRRNGDFDIIFNMNDLNDPLAIIGQGVANNLTMPAWQREEILAARTDFKHESQRRLWSGDHLQTSHVETEAEIFPEYRLAYVEKTIDIEHFGVSNRRRGSWSLQEEAVYTFYLPEGAVATSLSLWVNGVERKSRFTTKYKADNAYKTIVGVERRDPALLHWQEGNTLVVTVFPVRPDLPRKFKLGVTVPLRLVKDELVLENIYFEGPSARSATEKTSLHFVGKSAPQHVRQSVAFAHENVRDYHHEGSYRPYWELSCSAGPISPIPFSFNQKSYHAQPWRPQLETRKFQQVYLDLNKSWTTEEFNAIWNRVKGREVYTIDKQMVRLTPENFQEVFAHTQEMQYSVFPFHEVSNPETALVISKTAGNFVEMSDVRDSRFGIELMKYLEQSAGPVAFFNLGNELSPYLKSLREFQALNYVTGDLNRLIGWLKLEQYPRYSEDPGQVFLPGANMVIEQTDVEGPNLAKQPAPDHLMRLFAYNKTLERAGVCFLTDKDYSNEIVRMAAEAYVVSPFTSLIVLETDEDYDRFGIDSTDNSLGNAFNSSKMAANNTGSVPEPHEWLLIILVLMFLTWTQRHRFANLRFR